MSKFFIQDSIYNSNVSTQQLQKMRVYISVKIINTNT